MNKSANVVSLRDYQARLSNIIRELARQQERDDFERRVYGRNNEGDPIGGGDNIEERHEAVVPCGRG
jgi:hypothetical protein